MKIRYLATGLLLAFVALSAYSFNRSFPHNAKRGKMSLLPYPEVKIDNDVHRLSAGAKIWNQKNRIQTPSSLGSASYVINYTESGNGVIDRVWILTAGEAALPAPQQNTGSQ